MKRARTPLRIDQGPQLLLVNHVVPFKNGYCRVSRRCHDLEIVMAFLSPIVEAGMTEIMEGEALDTHTLTNRLMNPPDLIPPDPSPFPVKEAITAQGPQT